MEDLNASTYNAHCGSIQDELEEGFFIENNARVDMMRECVEILIYFRVISRVSSAEIVDGSLHKF